MNVDRDELLAEMTRLALGDDEAALYVAVLELGPCGVREAAEEAGVHRTSAYRILEDLAERGLVAMSTGQPMEVTPLGPEAFFESMRQEKIQEMDVIDEVEASTLKDLQDRLDADDRDEPSANTWRVIRGRDRIEEETAETIRNCQAEVCLVCGDPAGWEDPPGGDADPLKAIQTKADDLDIRALMDPDCLESRRGRNLRTLEGVDTRAVEPGFGTDTYILDTEVFAGLSQDDQELGPVVIWSDAPGLYENQRQMFEGLWKSARR